MRWVLHSFSTEWKCVFKILLKLSLHSDLSNCQAICRKRWSISAQKRFMSNVWRRIYQSSVKRPSAYRRLKMMMMMMGSRPMDQQQRKPASRTFATGVRRRTRSRRLTDLRCCREATLETGWQRSIYCVSNKINFVIRQFNELSKVHITFLLRFLFIVFFLKKKYKVLIAWGSFFVCSNFCQTAVHHFTRKSSLDLML